MVGMGKVSKPLNAIALAGPKRINAHGRLSLQVHFDKAQEPGKCGAIGIFVKGTGWSQIRQIKLVG